MSGVQYHITYSQILESQRRLNLSNIIKQFIQTFSPTSDEFIDVACDPYIEAIQYLKDKELGNNTNKIAQKIQIHTYIDFVKIKE